MQKTIYYIFLFLLINNVAFSQIEVTMASQFDVIASSSKMENKEFLIGAYANNQMFIVKYTDDSLAVTKYITTAYNEIAGVCSISVNNDTLFTKAIDSLFSEIKQNHKYQPYSKDFLISDNFFLVFYKKGNLQLFRRKDASQEQLSKIYFLHRRLNLFAQIPYMGQHNRIKNLKIENWKELLKYLTSGNIDSIPK